MKRALLVKMSSLGDVVHALPAVSDAAAEGWEFDWVVEEAFADIPRRHPAVRNTLPIAWRRWRRNLLRSRSEMAQFRRQLGQTHYNVVLDSQGLLKSAAVVRLAKADKKFGFAADSAREPVAARAYSQSFSVDRSQHAIDRQRQLFAAALGLNKHIDAPNFAIKCAVPTEPEPVCVLLHGTTWPSKHYPEHLWQALAQHGKAAGYRMVATWGNEAERERAQKLARTGNVEVWPKLSLAELMQRLESARMVIGVDSGLTHLAAALEVPTVALYGSTNATLTGARGAHAVAMSADFSCAPCLSRQCTFDREKTQPTSLGLIHPPCYATLDPQEVWRVGMETVHAHRVLHL